MWIWVFLKHEVAKMGAKKFSLLGLVELLADIIVIPLLPVELASGDRQLPSECLERRVRHGDVVLR